MRLNEILIEQQLDEKPMGFLSKMGNKIASKLPGDMGDTAQGKLQSGQEANELKKQFMQYLGQSRQKADPEVVIKWLASQGYPTKGAEQEMSKLPTSQKIGQAVGTAVGGIGKGIGNVAQSVKDIAKGAMSGAKSQDKKIPSQINTEKPTTALAASIDFTSTKSIMEALSGGQLDDIFLRAVGDKYAQQGGMPQQGKGNAPTDAKQGGAGGFMAGLKKGLAGTTSAILDIEVIPDNIQKKLKVLNAEQKKELLRLLG